MNGRRDLANIGGYRTDCSPMQVVSGPLHDPKIHFEAPPAAAIQAEMKRFMQWFTRTSPRGEFPLPTLTRAGIAHLDFVSIHPFEDGTVGVSVHILSLSQRGTRNTTPAISGLQQTQRANDICCEGRRERGWIRPVESGAEKRV